MFISLNKLFRFTRLPIDDGKDPLNWLYSRFLFPKSFINKSDLNIVEMNKNRWFNFVRYPMDEGMDPLNLFFLIDLIILKI